MTVVANTSGTTLPLTSGRVLAPAERADIEPTSHEAALIAAGQLTPVDGTQPRRRTGKTADDTTPGRDGTP